MSVAIDEMLARLCDRNRGTIGAGRDALFSGRHECLQSPSGHGKGRSKGRGTWRSGQTGARRGAAWPPAAKTP